MTTLVIYYGNKSELSLYLAKVQTELQSKGVTDVVWIINPKDISDLENQLATYQGKFESLFVDSHGTIVDGITTIQLTDKDKKVPIDDALKIFNKGNEESLKNIHLLSCSIGFLFQEEDFLPKLEDVTVNGQRVILHGDDDTILKHDSYAIMTSLIGSDSNIVANSIINSPAVVNVFVKLDEGSRTFSSQSFTSLEQKSISLKSFLPHMRARLKEANAFEKKVGLATREVDYSLLEDQNWLKTYFSKAFLTDLAKISGYERESSLLLAWEAAIQSQEVDINYIPSGGLGALHFGILNSRLELVEFVLKLGADANLYCNHRSPVHYAAEQGQVDMIKLLKSAGTKLDAFRSDTDTSALHTAVQNNHLNAVKYLHQNGVKYNHINLNVAVERGFIDIVRYFHETGEDLNIGTIENNSTALYIAVESGNLEMIDELCRLGVDVHIARTDTGATAILSAATQGSLPIIKLLYKFGAKLDVTCSKGYTILHVAAEYDHLDIVKYLYELDLNLESIISNLNESPLYIAARSGALDVVNFLIEKGEDLNIAENEEGWTPFMHLFYLKDIELIKKAIRYGADIDFKNKKGNSALFIAKKIDFRQSELDDFKEVAQEYKLVKEHSSHKNARAALDAAYKGDDKSFAGFLAEGMNVKYTRNKAGATFLHLAAHNNNLNIAKLCIDAGIDVNIARKDTGSTALYIAAQKGHIKFSDLLIENGSDLNIRHKVNGWTPFMHILYTKDIALIKKAISYGGNMNDAATLKEASAIGLDVNELLTYQKLVREENIAGVFPHAEGDYQAVDVTLPASNLGEEALETSDIDPTNEGWNKQTIKTEYVSAQVENDGEPLSFSGLPQKTEVIELDEITVLENELEGEKIPKVDLSYDNTIGEAYSEDNSDKKGEKMFNPSSVVKTKNDHLKIAADKNSLQLN